MPVTGNHFRGKLRYCLKRALNLFYRRKHKLFCLIGNRYAFLFIEQHNISSQTQLFFEILVKILKKIPAPPPPPHYMKKLCSLRIWTNHRNDLKYFKNCGNQQIRGSLACLFFLGNTNKVWFASKTQYNIFLSISVSITIIT